MKTLLLVLTMALYAGCNSETTSVKQKATDTSTEVKEVISDKEPRGQKVKPTGDLKEYAASFTPKQYSDVSDEDFKRGELILSTVRDGFNSKVIKFSDYWNLIMVLVKLKEEKSELETVFNIAREFDPKLMCQYTNHTFTNFKHTFDQFAELMPEVFTPYFEECKKSLEEEGEEKE